MNNLERIVSVDSGFFMRKESRKSPGFDKVYRQAMETRLIPHDSAQFSPAAQFLQKIRWRLLSLKTSADEKLHLHFIDDDIEFITEIDMRTFDMEGKQYFRMNDYFFIEGKRIQSTLVYGVDKAHARESDSYELLPLKAVKKFFERAVSDSYHHGLPFSAIPELVWFDGIKGDLDTELRNIMIGVAAVAEKVFQLQNPKTKSASAENQLVQYDRLIITEVQA